MTAGPHMPHIDESDRCATGRHAECLWGCRCTCHTGNRLAIADPPYPPQVSDRDTKKRASRWYGNRQRSVTDRPADRHPDAAEWDNPARHRQLLEQLMTMYDGWAIATSPDGLAAYHPLPIGCRIMAWVKPHAQPGSHRIQSRWEPVILWPPLNRRSNRNGVGMVPDVLIAGRPNNGFIGAKPAEWTHWVLDAMTYDPHTDTVTDIFAGSGAVTRALQTRPEPLFPLEAT